MHGSYEYRKASLEEVKEVIKDKDFQSAIGHESTAQVISTLLEIDCPVNRIIYQQQPGEIAIVFKMNGRPPEGKILTIKEIQEIGFSWGFLERKI
jgi:hypothetical protein